MTIGELIKQARQDAKMTQKQLGEKCGIADSAIRKYESGRVVPKICTIKKIANALDIPWYKLYSDDQYEQSGGLVKDFKERYGIKHLDETDQHFLIRETVENFYDSLNIDGKLAAYIILYEHSEDKVLAGIIQYQKK